jgi:hypothetical protein
MTEQQLRAIARRAAFQLADQRHDVIVDAGRRIARAFVHNHEQLHMTPERAIDFAERFLGAMASEIEAMRAVGGRLN